MNLSYKELLPHEFHADSRVWIYQSSRRFTIGEALQIEERLNEFVSNWHSHGVPVKGSAHLFFGQFILLIADESATGVSGCSTDSSVRLMKKLEDEFVVKLFDRQLLAFVVDDHIELIPLAQAEYALKNRFIGPETKYFNNTVQTKAELESNWIIPLRNSWLGNKWSLGNQHSN
jgi:hypothetical protein